MFVKCLASAWPLIYTFKNGSNVLSDFWIWLYICVHNLSFLISKKNTIFSNFMSNLS